MYIGEVTQYTAVYYTYMYMYTVPALYCACSDGHVWCGRALIYNPIVYMYMYIVYV